jgi:hypothetical protein
VEDLNKQYNFLEERLGKLDYPNFKVILQAKPIGQFPAIIAELKTGYLKIGDLNTKLLSKKPETIESAGIGHWGGFVHSGEYAAFNCYSVTVDMEKCPINILYELKITAESLGLRNYDDLACSWLGINSLQNSVNMCITYPIYACINQIKYQGASEVKVSLKIDEHLLENSTIWLNRSPSGDREAIIERHSYELKACQKTVEEGFYYITLSPTFQAINMMDKVTASIINAELGQLTIMEELIYSPSEGFGPFKKAFILFDAGKKMEERLLNPKEKEDLEFAFTWLLEMLNFSAINLGLGKDEIIREEKTQRGSADILAISSEDPKEIIVIDCTIGVPDGNKIDNIKNTSDYISRKIGIPIKPVIVTPAITSVVKEDGRKHGVIILDRTDIEKILTNYYKGFDWPALRIILGKNP